MNAISRSSRDKNHRFKRLAIVASAAVVVGLVSCATISHTLIAPPAIPGAEFVGTKTCAECHAVIVKDFKTATHALLKAEGNNAMDIGCESCHGAGSIHNQSGGAVNTIINPRKSPSVCFQCHLDKRGQFNLPSHHPVVEGKMSCGDCHDPHKGNALKGATDLATESQTCAKCHTAQAGPFVFEHEAVREGCTTCHAVHGSVNQKLLVARDANLCLRCHFQQQTTGGRILIGGGDHTSRMARGTCWTAGCHEAVHGSHIGSSLRF